MITHESVIAAAKSTPPVCVVATYRRSIVVLVYQAGGQIERGEFQGRVIGSARSPRMSVESCNEDSVRAAEFLPGK